MVKETDYKQKLFRNGTKKCFFAFLLLFVVVHPSNKVQAEQYDFDLAIGYANSAEVVEIPKHYGVHTPKTTINPSLHNDESPIFLNITNGTFEESSTQEIQISINYQSNTVYEKSVTRTGSELKNGTSIELNDFVMSAPTIEEFIQRDGEEYYYDGEITIGDVTRPLIMFYGYEEFGLTSTIIDNDNKLLYNLYPSYGHLQHDRLGYSKISLSTEAISSGRASAISVGYYNVETTIADGTSFDYSIYKKEGRIGQTSPPYYYTSTNISDYSMIKDGRITGNDFKNNALGIPIAIDESEQSTYYAFILQGNQVMKAFVAEIQPWNGPGIESYIAQSEMTQLYLENGGFISPKNTITIRLKGINFDNDKQYTVYPETTDTWLGATTLCKMGEVPSTDIAGHYTRQGKNGETIYCQTSWGHNIEEQTFTGEELNNGDAIIEVPYAEYAERYSDIFLVKDDAGNIYPGGNIEINYKDATELVTINPNSGYDIQTDTNFIKNVGKQTAISDFVGGLTTQNDDDHVEVEGISDLNRSLSTGMNARIKDAYDRTILELKVIVVGDTDGDGDITANDLAKERQHLSGKRLLEGVYKIAGSTSGDKEITPTDLARMRQDLSGKREMRQ